MQSFFSVSRLAAALLCLALPTFALADDPQLRCIHADGDAYAKYQLFNSQSASVSGKTAAGENYHCNIDVEEVVVYPPSNHVPMYFRILGTLRRSSCSPDMTVALDPQPTFVARPGLVGFHLYPRTDAVTCTSLTMDPEFATQTGSTALLPQLPPDNRDLRAYIGLYPYEPVSGLAFRDHPLVRAGIQAAMQADPALRWVGQHAGPNTPVEPHRGRLLSWGCEAHNCGPHHWSLLIGADGHDPEVCYFNAEVRPDQSQWFRQFQAPQWRAGTCPPDGPDAAPQDTDTAEDH